MSDSSNGPTDGDPWGDPPPPPPEWVAPPPPWTSYSPPAGGSAPGPPPPPTGDDTGSWAAFGAEPRPEATYQAVRPTERRRIPLMITGVIAVVTALIGLAIGTQLDHHNGVSSAAAPPVTATPGTTPNQGS